MVVTFVLNCCEYFTRDCDSFASLDKEKNTYIRCRCFDADVSDIKLSSCTCLSIAERLI